MPWSKGAGAHAFVRCDDPMSAPCAVGVALCGPDPRSPLTTFGITCEHASACRVSNVARFALWIAGTHYGEYECGLPKWNVGRRGGWSRCG